MATWRLGDLGDGVGKEPQTDADGTALTLVLGGGRGGGKCDEATKR